MDRNYHIFSSGTLERSDNTVQLVTDDDKKQIPIEHVEAIFLHGQIDFNTRLMSFLNSEGVAAHVFGWKDHYAGSVMPKRGQTSGQTVVAQVNAYETADRRMGIASSLVSASIHNMRANLAYYENRGSELKSSISRLDESAGLVHDQQTVNELMGVEATARKAYYSSFAEILPEEFRLERREFNPPPNEINSLISFGNSLVYANCVSAIRATALDPTISYLHEPGERRYSLSLDIADVFKPVLADRIVFRLLNRQQITTDDFESELDGCYLNESGRKTFTKDLEEVLEKTVEHPKLGRKVSYQYLLRLEAYKLKKHVLTGESYEAFKRWW